MRHFLKERIIHWQQLYSNLDGPNTTPEMEKSDQIKRVYTRYNLLQAVLDEIDRMDFDRLADFSDTRDYILCATQCAASVFTKSTDRLEQEAMQEERDLAGTFVRMQTSSDCLSIDPLPYTRRLSSSDSESIRSRIRTTWGIKEFCWHPIDGSSKPSAVEVFRWSKLSPQLMKGWLREGLASRGIDRYWMMHEFGWDRIESRLLIDPGYFGEEQICTSESLDWIAYFSHEDSATLGGWALDLTQELVPD